VATIDDRVDKIQFLLGNRTDIDDRIIQWGVDAYRELGASVPFKELEDTLEDTFVVDQDVYDYPDDARAILSLVGFRSSGAPYPIRKKDIRVIERFQTITSGRPAIWAPFGAAEFIIRPKPATADDYRIRFWTKPVIDGTPEDTELLMPDDWLTVFDHLAALQGNIALGQASKAQELNVLLHGDPRRPSEVGWIKKKMLRDAAEMVVSDYATDPMIRSYTR
jgi:hypothetical protein